MAMLHDLAEHTGTLLAIIGVLVALIGTLIAVVWKITLNVATTLKEDIFEMIEKLDDRISAVWSEITKIRDRQVSLRVELPKEYLRIGGPGYRVLIEGITRIETHFETFAQDCRDGKCGRKIP